MREILYRMKWKRFHPASFAKFAALKANEYLSLDELMARQELARQVLVRGAMEHTAFYPKSYGEAGFEIGDIGKDGWFERLPVVTKKELREHFDEFVNPEARQFLRVSTTGGSTGTPTKTGYDGRAVEEVYGWRLLDWFGVKPWDNHAYVWRDTRHSLKSRLINAALWWPTKHLKLDATFITDDAIEKFLRGLNRVRPTLLQGYVGAVTQVAQYVIDHPEFKHSNIRAFEHFPKVVWTTSAPLSAVQRSLIQAAFNAPVCDQYGSCEIRWIAQQCAECKGLHVNAEHVSLEYVDENNKPVPNGEYGKTLLTNLEDFVFPLIRYENGDRGRYLTESCSCGRTLPCIDAVKGRESESFVLPSGKTINGEYLTTIFDATPDLVRGFRVVQHKDASILIEYIPNAGGNEREILKVLEAFAVRLGGEVPIEFKKVDSIPHDRGKLRFVVREK